MRMELLAVIIQEGTKLCSEFLRLRPVKIQSSPPPAMPAGDPPRAPAATSEEGEDKIAKGTACLPCTNNHMLACVGLLDEAHRMSPDGLNEESMVRVDKCLKEIAAAERVDLAPENVAGLPEEERVIADYAAKELREIRHGLDGLTTREQLEEVTVRATNLQKHVGREWFKIRLARMPQEKKDELAHAAMKRLEEE